MSVEAEIIKRRIEHNRKRLAALSGNVLREQEAGYIEEEIMLLQSILKEAKEPVMETQVDVELTLSVDSKIELEDIKGRILAFLGQSDGITPMSITLKEEAEIYGNI
jgi:type IV secretory pathway protease TraF